MNGFRENYDRLVKSCECALRDLLPVNAPEKLKESMSYALFGGGKRLRPVLYLAVISSYGITPSETDLKVAAAIEFIHTYSLVHDDLPAMDDDDMRRGRPSDHAVFGEAIALLTGDALLTSAFGALADCACENTRYARIMKLIADCAGAGGMIAGQALEFTNDLASADAALFGRIAALKTGKLIEAAVVGGCLAAGREDKESEWRRYSAALGTAFQLRDDLLDLKSGEHSLAAALGDAAESELEKLRRKAECELNLTGGDPEFLRALTDVMLLRNSDSV